ncbi:hypothetical protein JCGZ_01936 [Jatropha curcas]|uniref:Uncharacterized protein n=1 Tax=Jatropha curcas TaxID=180498 RepID=A0A067JG56_JATCU|nr:hypothetical protein JCGZ_01936 [Jatropha curcas]
MIKSKILQADQTEPRRCLQSQSNRALESFTADPTGADKADQTEQSRWPDDQINSTSFKPTKSSFEDDRQIEGASMDHFNINHLYN